ncbi:asparagine synthase-related protein [bacterium]|jgi:asparagine synthase (glutamine-hydrolysing)|nr:asparagine synthase-related protein [bacterium]MDA7680666.1 asparagine synthase-related protein [bacterium]MDB4746111.1 asparagine synthase-related protein [Verrucomicrobiota bacterium]
MHQYVERVVNLIDSDNNLIYNMTEEEARQRVWSADPKAVNEIEGSFSLLAKEGKTVRMARSLDRPTRYFLAKRQEGPALIVADRMDQIFAWLKSEGFEDQFHPSYCRMVPAHYIVSIELIGCPDPDPIYTRYFDPQHNQQPKDIETIGRNYIGALTDEIGKWLQQIPEKEPIGVCFSGGIDSGAVFLATYHALKGLGMNPSRLKAFTLSIADGEDHHQAFSFLDKLGLSMFLEVIEVEDTSLDVDQTLRILEDYKPLDVECGAMGLALCRAIRERYPNWKYLVDGDGGDENLKDYPIEENPELTIRSVVHNQMLYHEGWGVGKIKHSLTYSGGLSRSYTRTYAPARHFKFEGFSPFTRPKVISVSEGIPFIELTDYDHEKLYELKGQIAAAGVRQVIGLEMPVFPKRRFQHGATPVEKLREKITDNESELRRRFQEIYQ